MHKQNIDRWKIISKIIVYTVFHEESSTKVWFDPQLHFLRKIHLIDSMLSSVIDVVSWFHFGRMYDLSLGKPLHLTWYLFVNGPVIKRDKIHCVLTKDVISCGDPFNRVLAAKMRMVGISWISLRFPCATIFL